MKEVYDEWKMVAKAFPFLELQCRLMNGETCEEETVPVIDFFVNNGKVRMSKPKGI